ncbi:hypothetical protein RFI_19887, partial [Reticulomyxa filosa]
EAQYQNEKEEWMKVFKEEYQKKVIQFKEGNNQLVETTKKLETEISELKMRLGRTRREKVNWKPKNASLVFCFFFCTKKKRNPILYHFKEEGAEQLFNFVWFERQIARKREDNNNNNNNNNNRKKKWKKYDEEVREKTQSLIALQEIIRQKEIDYETLSGAKVQLDNEIS